MDTEISVARAVFTGALLTRDTAAPPLHREDAVYLIDTLFDVVHKCTSSNVRSCKNFILRYVLPSLSRTTALTRYIMSIAKAWAQSTGPESALETAAKAPRDRSSYKIEPAASFKTLHLLYVVHDVLAFVSLTPAHTPSAGVVEQLQNIVPSLAQLAACGDSSAAKQARECVKDLLISWEKHDVLPKQMLERLQQDIDKASKMDVAALLSLFADEEAQAALIAHRAKQEATKWIVPQSHQMPHDMAAPWYDLPAANGLYQKHTQGVMVSANLPQGGYHLRNGGRQADAKMQADVEGLLYEAKRCFDQYTDAAEVKDIDALGNIVWKDGINRKRRNCWGWSYDHIEQRQRMLNQMR